MSNETMTGKAVQWRYYSYDVWGNAKDGYEVNEVFRTPDVIEIPEDVNTDLELFTHLKKTGFLTGKRLQARLFETDHNVCCEDTIYFSYKGKPEGEFRRETDEV